MKGALTSPAFIRRLESLHLLARKVLGGRLQAQRRSTRRGSGVAFADYAPYYPGDDYRAIDWRVLARFDALLIKLFEVEEDTTLHLLVDTSRSMTAKLTRACEVAAALGYIALHHHETVALHWMEDRLRPALEPGRGRARVWELLRTLESAEAQGADTDLLQCARQLHSRHRRRGLVVVISDFFCPEGYERALSYLTWAGHEVFCLQLLDPADLTWSWLGDCDLTCVETGSHRRLTITQGDADRFAEAIQNWNAGLERCCKDRQIGLAATDTRAAFDHIVLDLLRRGGLTAATEHRG